MKKILLLLSLLPAISFADDKFYTADPSKAPQGIVIVPMAKLDNKMAVSSLMNEQKTKGYVYNENNDAMEMIKDTRNQYRSDINNIDDPKDTHMKSDFNKIKLGFKFTPINFINNIGYAVGGAYIENKGWTAISSFFEDKEIGACKFKVNSMKLSHGAVRITEEQISHEINGKVTSIYIEGTPKSGFVYNVMWDDNDYNYFLVCANPKYDAAITFKAIQLAKKIDKSRNGLTQ